MYIKQAAQLVGVSAATIRGWEALGLVEPERTASGYRLYRPSDIARLREVRDLVRVERLNAAGARRVLGGARSVPARARRRRTPPAGADAALGTSLRRLREAQGLSIRELAQRTGLSASTVSSIERSLHRPSVASLQKLAAALGTNLSLMLGDVSPSPTRVVVRPGERRLLHLGTPGIVIEQLAHVERALEPSIVRVAPGAGSDEDYCHDGEEFVYVLAGELEMTLDGGETYVLAEGDAITFPSRKPHRWRNPGDVEASALWVNTPPTF